jgi:hypothetical protein
MEQLLQQLKAESFGQQSHTSSPAKPISNEKEDLDNDSMTS